MKNKFIQAINLIINFKKDFDRIDERVPRKLIGELGEFYVLRELEKQKFEVDRKGGSKGYDIYLKKIDKRVEVRTSLPKNEGLYPDKDILFWGWKVEGKNQKKAKKFDYLLCVSLEKNFKKPKFYVFTHKEAFSVDDITIGRFSDIKKKIHLFAGKQSYKKALKLKPEFISLYERKINLNPSQFLNKWQKIK